MRFYLEISPRQSGKTTRLVKDVKKFIIDTVGTAIIIGARNNNLKDLKEKFTEREQRFIKFISSSQFNLELYNKIEKEKEKENNHEVKYYFDEFDFFRKESLFLLSRDCYYVTTPKFLRESLDEKSFLLDLIRYNDNVYFKHLPNARVFEMDDQLGDEFRKTECLGDFFI